MRGVLFRPRLWIAGAILGLTLAGACNLNPQPLPPGYDQTGGGNDNSSMGGPSTPGSSSGSGSVPASDDGGSFASSSGAGASSGASSGTNPPPIFEDAGVVLGSPDGGAEPEGDAALALDAAADSGPASDGGSDGPSPDAALDDASTSDGGCAHPSQCYLAHPGACALCAWPMNYPVCVEHQCRCACDERDASGE